MATTLVKISMPIPRLTRTSTGSAKDSIYNLGDLAEGEAFQLADVVDLKKAKSKLQSAVGAYRARTGDKQTQFAVRSWKLDDGTDAVAVWRVAAKAEADVVPTAEVPATE